MIKGKALLIIERLDSKHIPFDVTAYVQSCSGDHRYQDDAWGCLNTDTLPLPAVAYKLKVGERVWVSVVYEFHYFCDYWGEWDVDLTYHKERTLKRTKLEKQK